jgi:hypothetical protein
MCPVSNWFVFICRWSVHGVSSWSKIDERWSVYELSGGYVFSIRWFMYNVSNWNHVSGWKRIVYKLPSGPELDGWYM